MAGYRVPEWARDARILNRTIGHSWFDHDTMKAFGTRFHGSPDSRGVFVASNETEGRRYFAVHRLRSVTVHGEWRARHGVIVDLLSSYPHFDTEEDARQFAESHGWCPDHGTEYPLSVVAGSSHLGGTHRAVCVECGLVFACYECACEWAHDCGGVS